MLVAVKKEDELDNVFVFAKGAPEVIKDMVTESKDIIEKMNNEYAKEGLRNLAFSYRIFSKQEYEKIKDNEESLATGHKYLGLISQKDPLRPEVKEAMHLARKAGIESIMITGDHKLTAANIAKELQLITTEDEVMDGTTLGDKKDEELYEILKTIRVFARVSPEQKLNIVKAMKSQGYITAVTGDGVNDAPAIKTADIGISMGITGTDVSKEVSDMVLQDDNYATIVSAIEQGRIIYDNIVKFITYLISCNIAEILIVALAMFLTPVSALLPIHILWINLITDGAPALALSMEPGESDVMSRKPRPKGHLLNKERWTMILLQSFLITIGTFTIFIIGLEQSPQIAQTAVFTTLGISELFRSLNNRSETHSIFSKKLKPNFALYWTIVGSLFVQLFVVYTPIGNAVLKTVPLNGSFLGFSILLALLPIIGTEFYKYAIAEE
jgi:Ca2+-transporting ATPase